MQAAYCMAANPTSYFSSSGSSDYSTRRSVSSDFLATSRSSNSSVSQIGSPQNRLPRRLSQNASPQHVSSPQRTQESPDFSQTLNDQCLISDVPTFDTEGLDNLLADFGIYNPRPSRSISYSSSYSLDSNTFKQDSFDDQGALHNDRSPLDLPFNPIDLSSNTQDLSLLTPPDFCKPTCPFLIRHRLLTYTAS